MGDTLCLLVFILSPASFFRFSGILEGKDRDDPKTVPLKIFAKDIGNCAYVRSRLLPLCFFLCQNDVDIAASFCPSAGLFSIFYVTNSPLSFSNVSLQAKTLAVSNADSTDDVIRMALLQFGISVSNQRLLLIFASVHTHFYPFDVVSKVMSADPC